MWGRSGWNVLGRGKGGLAAGGETDVENQKPLAAQDGS